MTSEDYVIATVLVLACVAAYFLYWLGWCWALSTLWPDGPQWVTRPTFTAFFLACITGVIITLLIIRTAP